MKIDNTISIEDIFFMENDNFEMLSDSEIPELEDNPQFVSELLDVSSDKTNVAERISYISVFPNILPHGIIQCKIPNDEFVSLELKTKRNSIIVINSRNEIYNYGKSTFYYYDNFIDINEYISSNKSSYNKFFVLPSNLKNLIREVGNLNDYFLVIKDMDRLLYENSYKGNIEDIMDIYINDFEKDNRCLFVNDCNIFTNPNLIDEERSCIGWHNLPSRNLRLYHIPTIKDEKGKSFCNLTGCIADVIKGLPKTDKVLIFYPSIKAAKQIAMNISEEMQKETAIVCSEMNAKMAESFYSNLNENRQTLSKRIVIWVNNDLNFHLKDKYHLITISDTRKGSTMLTLKSIHQLYQVNEDGANNILSDTIIYNTTYFLEDWDNQYAELLKRADKIRQLYDAMDGISKQDNSLNNIFGIAKNVICHKATGQLYGRFSPFELTRKDIDGKYEIAYMNFDSMKFRTNLIKELYNRKNILSEKLSQYYTITDTIENKKNVTLEQTQIKEEIKLLDRKIKKNDWLDALEEIENELSLEEHDENSFEQFLKRKANKGNNTQRNLYKGFLKLYPYMEVMELIYLLKGIKCSTITPLKNLNNSIMFWALEDEHPFKKAVMEAFPVGSQSTNEEIEDRLKPILHYHLHKKYPERSRKVIALFKCFLKTDRPRTKYRIFLDDRYINHKARISKEENNLLGYFYV